jgi:transcriptional regulator with XRE-family HTH domain
MQGLIGGLLMGRKRRVQPKRLAYKLREIRKRLELSQQELADQFKHIPAPPYPGLISRYEQGKAEPSLLVLLEYTRLAGIAMEVLVDDKQDLPRKI